MSGSTDLVRAGGPGTGITNYGAYPPAQADRMDLSESVNFFHRQLKLILFVTGAALLAGLLISLFAEKAYRAEATVMLTNDAAIVTQSTATASAQPVLSSEVVDTQIQIITSQEMAKRVAEGLNLTEGMTDGEQRALLAQLQEHVSAMRAGESYALTISYQAEEAKVAADIANEFARQFVNWELDSERQRNADARNIVEQRLTELRDQAQADTQALQQYRIRNNLLSTSGASLTEQEIATYNQEVTTARAEAAADQARLRTALAQLRSGSTGDDVGEALDSPVISSLRSQEALAAASVADLSAKYGPNHPTLIRVQSQLDEVRRRIEAEIGRVVSNLRANRGMTRQDKLLICALSLACALQIFNNVGALIPALEPIAVWAIATGLIYSGAVYGDRLIKRDLRPIMRPVGLMTYPLYLNHFILGQALLPILAARITNSTVLLLVLFSILLANAWLIAQYPERWVQRKLRQALLGGADGLRPARGAAAVPLIAKPSIGDERPMS